jgi:pimeloyl-ACP methyl ester carboxylesterase
MRSALSHHFPLDLYRLGDHKRASYKRAYVLATIQTKKGPIEVGRRGSGPPVLFVHGTPGGADSSLAMGWFLAEAGFGRGIWVHRWRGGTRSISRPTSWLLSSMH